MGRNIYFTEAELGMVREYATQAIDILGEGEETGKRVDDDMENGLGSTMRKLYKGCNGESLFAEYKTKRK